jgi:hypothetical protein
MGKIKVKKFTFLLLVSLVGNLFVFKYTIAAAHPAGTNISSNGTVYMVTDDSYIRPYTSAGAFLSYGFNSWTSVQPATPEDLALPQGKFIPPRDGKIICSDRGADKGTCYLMTNGMPAGFVSESVFNALGFSFKNDLTGDVSFLTHDTNISSPTEQHRPGVLINNNGTLSIVTINGLLSVPSTDVLTSWGYTASDAVPANTADGALSQVGVLSTRQGSQLSPITNTTEVSSSSLLQSYIDTYPNLPVTTISAPEDGAEVIDLVKTIEALPGSTIEPSLPYMTTESVNMINQVPSLKNYFDSPSIHLAGMNTSSNNVEVFEGDTYALYTETQTQQDTGYTNNVYWVCEKESGTWKWDLIGSLKYDGSINQQNNPAGNYVSGTGNNDIGIVDAAYTNNPTINDPNTGVILELENYGQTTITKFDLSIGFNNTNLFEETENYQLKPNQTVYLAIPLYSYWSMNGASTTPGQFSTQIQVGLGSSTLDNNASNNTKTITGAFQQNTTGVVNNLVGN